MGLFGGNSRADSVLGQGIIADAIVSDAVAVNFRSEVG